MSWVIEFRNGGYFRDDATRSGPIELARQFLTEHEAEAFVLSRTWMSFHGAMPKCVNRTECLKLSQPLDGRYAPQEVAEAFSLYLNSTACMAMFAKLLLYRAIGDNAKVVVTYKGKNYRVSIRRTNGEVEHFNRDGQQ